MMMVSVKCYTFNHAPYIRECLEGFVMQQTGFDFEVIVHDDASTDGTTEIVESYARQYPHLFKVITEKENLYSRGGMKAVHAATDIYVTGKYTAVCEGDDCWTDPHKLSMQVAFMEANPEYGMCYTRCRYRFESKGTRKNPLWGGPSESFADLMNRNTIPTASALVRTELERKYVAEVDPMSRGWKMGDYPKWLWMSHESKVKFMDACTTVYRARLSSASHSQDIGERIAFIDNAEQIARFMERHFGYREGSVCSPLRFEKSRLYHYAAGKCAREYFRLLFSRRELAADPWCLLLSRYFILPRKQADRI